MSHAKTCLLKNNYLEVEIHIEHIILKCSFNQLFSYSSIRSAFDPKSGPRSIRDPVSDAFRVVWMSKQMFFLLHDHRK